MGEAAGLQHPAAHHPVIMVSSDMVCRMGCKNMGCKILDLRTVDMHNLDRQMLQLKDEVPEKSVAYLAQHQCMHT